MLAVRGIIFFLNNDDEVFDVPGGLQCYQLFFKRLFDFLKECSQNLFDQILMSWLCHQQDRYIPMNPLK